MQLAEESEFVEDEYSFSLAVNRPKESKLSANCLLSNKGNVKDCDRKSFLFSEIPQRNLTKKPRSTDIIEFGNIESGSDCIVKLRVKLTRRASFVQRMYIDQRKLSSYIILADIFN